MQQERIRVIAFALFLGVVVTLLKFTAFFITHSNAIYTDALENIINVVAAAVAFYSIYLSARPKDLNHPYGHGKVEFFAVGFEGALISFAGLNIFYRAVYALVYPQEIHQLSIGIYLTCIAGVINFALGKFLVSKGKSLQSMTLEADGKHLLSDAYTSIGLLIGLVVIYFTQLNFLDSIISMILGAAILWSGYQLLRKSVAGLMDEVDEQLVEKIVSILNLHRKAVWIDVHNLRAQKYGPDIHIDCHVTLPFYLNLQEMHAEIKEIENLIEQQTMTNVELFIHVDPCLPECCYYCKMSNCTVRQHTYQNEIQWTKENVMLNAKHFHSDV
jgi:cation diffusion facilitator family transporter